MVLRIGLSDKVTLWVFLVLSSCKLSTWPAGLHCRRQRSQQCGSPEEEPSRDKEGQSRACGWDVPGMFEEQ